jgi:sulfotransferase family protein
MPSIVLDFLGIGAPKAGTTSLHEYLRTHPQLWLPEAKEQPFFTNDDAYNEGWETFAAVAFHGAPPGRRYGKITPHYMGGPVAWHDATGAAATEPATAVTARRIAEQFPDVKLIAMVRDPVERTISSYWQTTFLGDDHRSLNEALADELSEEALEAARTRPTQGHQHIVAGEYGRGLEAYLRLFPRDQLFVGSTALLGDDPMALLRDLYRFLGVDDAHIPPNLGVRYQVRGTGRRSRLLATLPRVVKETPGLRHTWNALPDRTRASARAHLRTLAYRLDQRTAAPHEGMEEMPDPALIERLQQHFAPDVALVETLVGPVPGVTDLPWVSARRDGSAGAPTKPAGPTCESRGCNGR